MRILTIERFTQLHGTCKNGPSIRHCGTAYELGSGQNSATDHFKHTWVMQCQLPVRMKKYRVRAGYQYLRTLDPARLLGRQGLGVPQVLGIV